MKKGYTNLARAFDALEYVKFIMEQVLKGFSKEEIRDKFIKENPFGIKTEKSRATFARWLINDYTKTYDQFELPILARLLTQDNISQQAKRELLFYTTCQADNLACLLTTDILYPAFQNGLSSIDRNELIQFVSQNTSLSKSTVERAVLGYIMLLKKLSLILTDSANTLNFKYFSPKIESFAFILFLLNHRKTSPVQIIHSKDFHCLFMSPIDVINSIRELESRNLVRFAMAGDIVRLELKISFEELPNVL